MRNSQKKKQKAPVSVVQNKDCDAAHQYRLSQARQLLKGAGFVETKKGWKRKAKA